MRYFNFVTFDITGDLTFGESFGSLVSEDYDHWIANIFRVIRLVCVIQVMRCYGLAAHKLFKVIPALAKGMEEHKKYTEDKMTRRLENPTDRKDFMRYGIYTHHTPHVAELLLTRPSYVLKHNDERGMTRAEMNANSSILIMAGSETSATLLSGLVYHLLQNPIWMTKLQDEVRSTFTEEAQITFTSTSQLKLMTAIIQETFRVYPPVAGSMPRIVPKEGAVVAGTFIPGDTVIGIPQYVASRSSRNFTDPDKFAPERFLGDERYAADKRSVMQPFSVGPRNCIGQTLAWAEVRTILGRLIWNFDMELLDASKGWERQMVFVLWSKPSLMVKLRAREL
jgi:cytochrome P450